MISGWILGFFVLLFLLNKRVIKKICNVLKAIHRDLKYVRNFLKIMFKMRNHEKSSNTIAKVFAKTVAKHSQKTAIFYDDDRWTFQDIEDYSNKIANYFKQKGYKKGDTVALFLENRPEYICIWLGLSKIGVITALINSNLINEALVHCIELANPKSVIFGSSLLKAFQNVAKKITTEQWYQLCDKQDLVLLSGAMNLSMELKNNISTQPPTEELKQGKISDILIYIYTSGTTGLPKAGIFTNKRFFLISVGTFNMAGLEQNEIVYDCLPLYHTSGGVLPLGLMLLEGCSLVLKKKFSASNFWNDCIKYNCTIAFYIGEICRYVLSAHQNDHEVIQHSVTKILGNGLKPQIWEQFAKKFNIERVIEVYGSSEGNANIMNLDNKLGSVGYYPSWASFLYPLKLIRCDVETGTPIRGTDGLCQITKPHEPGLFVSKIIQGKSVSSFSGYLDKSATEKKYLRNVTEAGDYYFNTGDILYQDEEGYYYFHDRIGDTFRWKGENVATNELEAIISNFLDLNDAVVYGVKIPNIEGRAGMVAIVDTMKTLDLDKFANNLRNSLPAYAIPLFVRIINEVPLTGTFKLRKTELQKEGFDVDLITDQLYFYESNIKTYIFLTKDKYRDIVGGKIKL